MRICPLRDVLPGMLLGRSLYDANGQLLLRAGYTIDAEIIRQLRQIGLHSVYIHEEGTEEVIPEEAISVEVRSRASKSFSDTIQSVTQASAERKDIQPAHLHTFVERGAEYRNVVPADRVAADVTSIVDEVMEIGENVLNQTLLKSRSGYYQEHAIDTALLAVMIGRNLQYNRRELVELGTGAFLHDLGKLAMPGLCEKPPQAYTEDEQILMRQHPTLGKTLLARSTDRLFMAQSAIQYHHERQDGLGYPLGIPGCKGKPQPNGSNPTKTIFPLAQVIAVADYFDNLIAGRNAAPLSADAAMRELVKGVGTLFNEAVVKSLSEVVAVFPTGAMARIVECSNRLLLGSTGAIMKPNLKKPHHPIMVLLRNARGDKITPKTIDLESEPVVRLELAF